MPEKHEGDFELAADAGFAADASGLQLDHVFLFAAADGRDAERLAALGLTESTRISQPQQGTSHVIYCFDNAYLDLVSIDNPEVAERSSATQVQLGVRADWWRQEGSPFGFGWRTDPPGGPCPLPSWDYAGPSLPAGMTIPVADSSDDAGQPMIFMSAGDKPPADWTDGRAGNRQRPAGLAEIVGLRLEVPAGAPPSEDLLCLAETGMLDLVANAPRHRLTLVLSRIDDRPPRRLVLPDMAWAPEPKG